MTTNGYQPFLVANQRTALDLSITDSWLEPQDAFTQIFDGYQYLGVNYKRNGQSYFAAFPSALNLGAYVNISAITSTASAQVTTIAPHGLSSGTVIQITGVVWNPAIPNPVNGIRWTITVIGGAGSTTFTLNNPNPFAGVYASGGTVSVFLDNPITMIASWFNQALDTTNEQAIMIVCDTKRAAYYDTTAGVLTPIGFTDQFHRTGKFKFWYENYFGYLFITNNSDPIFWYNPNNIILAPNQNEVGLNSFNPALSATTADIVNTCLMIRGVSNRLVLFNTNEFNTSMDATHQYSTRVRWCQSGVDPVATTNAWYWLSSTQGLGGAQDLLASNYIITLGQIQDNIIITSQIVSQSNPYAAYYLMGSGSDTNYPFSFIKISNSRPVDSTFGTIVLDRQLTEVGATDLSRTDGNTVNRYDDKIPNLAVDEFNQTAIDNCFGIRNDALWQTWLLYTPTGSTINTRALIYNYKDKSWSQYRWDEVDADFGFNVMGLSPFPIADPDNSTNILYLLGGDYNGVVWLMDSGGGDAANNVPFLNVPNNGLAIEMDLITRQWFPFANQGKAAQLGYIDLLITGDVTTEVELEMSVEGFPPYKTVNFTAVTFLNAQTGGITAITRADPVVITAPDNDLITGQTVWIYGVQGMTQLDGATGVVDVIDENNFSIPSIDSSTYSAYTGGGIYTTKEGFFKPFWTRIWSGQIGTFHQFEFINEAVDENFELHAMIFWFKVSGRLYQGG